VYCDFIKAGKHEYVVSYENNIKEKKQVEEKEETQKINEYASISNSQT